MQRFNEMMGQSPEEKERGKISVTFFFSAHGIPQDYHGIEHELKKADVFVIEAHAWDQSQLTHLQDIADGKKVPVHIQEGRNADNILDYEEELLYNTGKRVEIIDVPEGHELANEDDGTSPYSDIAETFVSQGDLAVATQDLTKASKKNADYIRRKDAFIEERLKELLHTLSKDQGVSNVLVQMGSTHTGISHDLLKQRKVVRAKNEVLFDFSDQLIRSYRFGKEPSQELVEKALMENLLKFLYVEELIQMPYVLRTLFFREQLQHLTHNQIQQIGSAMETDYLYSVMQLNQYHSKELQRQIFSKVWKSVIGYGLEEKIADALRKSRQDE